MKGAIKAGLHTSLGWTLASRALRPRGVTVLMYHRITVPGERFPGTHLDLFRAQMRWLRARCRLITAEQLDDAAREAHAGGAPPVLVTFDDGYRDYHDRAYPVLDELGIPAVVFLATQAIDTGRMLWTDEVTWAVRHTSCEQAALPWRDGAAHSLHDAAARDAYLGAAKHDLKAMPDAQRVACLGALYAELKIDPSNAIGRQMLDWREVRATSPLTTWGGHTHRHPILSQVDADEAEREISTCRDRIEAETGRAPWVFAYPNGRAQDFTVETQALLRKHGYTQAYSTIEGLHHAGADLYAIRRQHTGGATLGDFALRVLGR